jgi:hypothetical protein
MGLKPKYSVGDLVRRRSLLSSKNSGYGIIIEIGMDSIRCLWNDGKEITIASAQIYLIAKGQRGEKS